MLSNIISRFSFAPAASLVLKTAATPLPGYWRIDADTPLPSAPAGPQVREFNLQTAQRSPFVQSVFAAAPAVQAVLIAPPASVIVKVDPHEWPAARKSVEHAVERAYNDKKPVEAGPVTPSTEQVLLALENMADAPASDRVEAVVRMVVRPVLQADGGDCHVHELRSDGTLAVELQGACGSCPSAGGTLKNFVQKIMTQFVPEVKNVERVDEDGNTI